MDFNIAAKLSNPYMLRLILISYLTAHVIGNQITQNTWLEVRVVCPSTVQVTCSGNGVTQMWNIYKTAAANQQTNNMIKVVHNGTKCDTIQTETIKSSQCTCLNDTHIRCNLYNEGIANEGGLWQCTRFSNGSTYRSNTIGLPSQQSSICSTTSVPEIVTENESSTKDDIHMKTVTQVTVITETAANEYITTTEIVTVNTTHYTNNLEENDRKEDTKAYITKLAQMIAGPFMVFFIGLVVFIYRKTLMSGLKRARGTQYAARTVECDSASGHTNVNVTPRLHNVILSNANSSWPEPVTIRSHTAVILKSLRSRNEQPDVQTEVSFDDDLLYSSVTDTTAFRQVSEMMSPNNGSNMNSNPHHAFIDFRPDDDQFHSTVNYCDEGACGYSAHGRQEQSSEDPLDTDTESLAGLYTTVKKNRPSYNQKYKGNPLYAFHAMPSDGNDPLKSKVMKEDIRATANNPLYSVDDKNDLPSIHENDEIRDDPLYSIVNKGEAVHLVAKNVAPVYSTVNKEKALAKTSNRIVDAYRNEVDPLYSVVNKKKIRGMLTDKMTQSVPPASACSNSVIPP